MKKNKQPTDIYIVF